MNITTKTFSRRSGEHRPCDAQEAVAMHACKGAGDRPSEIAMAFVAVLLLIAVLMLTGCADDLDTYAASQADLADAIATAAKEAGQ